MIQKTHTVIDLIEEGLYPMSDFVLERNFQRRFDDTSKEILLPVTRLYTPSITIARVLAKTSVSGESLYDVAAVLTTRQGDQIVLSKSNATDAELRQNEDDNIFYQKAQIISSEISRYFSSDIQISYNTRKRIILKCVLRYVWFWRTSMKKVSISTIMRQLIWNIYMTQLPNSVFHFLQMKEMRVC